MRSAEAALGVERERADRLARDAHRHQTHSARLEALLDSHASDEAVSLSEHLAARGARGELESKELVGALVRSGRLGALLDAVAPTDSGKFADWLDDSTVLLGSCGACPDVGTRAVLRVPSARCEVCSGSDIRRAGRKLVDACLSHGLTRLTVVGGSPKYHRQLRDIVQHHRLKLRLVPGTVRRTRKQARYDLRGSDVVVVWGPTLLAHSTSELYTNQADQGRLVVVQHRGIGQMLNTLTQALLADDT